MFRSGSGEAPSASDGEFHSYDEEEDPLPLPTLRPATVTDASPIPSCIPSSKRLQAGNMTLLPDTDEDSLTNIHHTAMTAPSGVQMVSTHRASHKSSPAYCECWNLPRGRDLISVLNQWRLFFKQHLAPANQLNNQ